MKIPAATGLVSLAVRLKIGHVGCKAQLHQVLGRRASILKMSVI